ncbi:TPA: response regulator transcription factor [Bacillus cereus]|uniref:response regulator transcription factor n=1 Tax=unclassified Bacillus (in: firmicutes) TaxID=185979 RepID=UPI0012621C5C|nr:MULTISPECIES: response regulator transcription factor [unclassified Bacillus (in: firmicutes)]MCX2703909.1 response regulator transcription factor [Bacillus sp. AS_5]HDR4868272.1 response regulator transcription factor [Bacillus cereus]KAB7677943.1 response regulator transcription factor [Bacillus sp. B1-WWTP-T-0.5-Post-4]MCW4655575.1 response regulator transcription factor [Bacillus sp. AS_3]HDR4879876.1 response regulator transcription factor [Bacillus cereus]
MISVLVVDDHVAVGLGTKALIERYDDIKADVLHNSEEVSGFIQNKQYDVYLIDLQMPKINGLALSKNILNVQPEAAILIFTGFDVFAHYNLLIDNGVLGVLSKTSSEEQVINAIRHAVKKEVVLPYQLVRQLRITENISNIDIEDGPERTISLNEEEKKILVEVSNGKTNRELAEILNLSQRSVEYKLTDIFHKLQVSSRMEAVQKAQELGVIYSLTI